MRAHEYLCVLALATLLLAGAAARLDAQFGEVQPGARVRIVAPGAVAGRVDGTIVRASHDTLWLSLSNAAPSPVPVRLVHELDVSRGRSRVAGGIRGAIMGAAAGVVLGLSGNPNDDGMSATEFFLTQIVGATAIGAGIGAYVGREQWEHFELAAATAVEPRSRLLLGLSYSF
jgi:hypothetical protein